MSLSKEAVRSWRLPMVMVLDLRNAAFAKRKGTVATGRARRQTHR